MAKGEETGGAVRHWLKATRGKAVDRAAGHYDIGGDALRNLRSLSALAGPTSGGVPTEFLPMAASMLSGYALTPFAQQLMQGWVLPYWLRMQASPASPSFVPHGHTFLRCNLTHRNWTGVGICGLPEEGSVDERGLVTPWPYGPSVDIWLLEGETLVCPSELEVVEQHLVDDLPLVRTRFASDGLVCELTTFVAPFDAAAVVLTTAVMRNEREQDTRCSLVVSARPYNTESIDAINRLAWLPGDRCFKADDDILAYLPEPPDRVLLSDFAHGDVAQQLRGERPPVSSRAPAVEEPYGMATGAAVYDLDLAAGESRTVLYACPLSAGTRPSFLRMLPQKQAERRAVESLAAQREAWAEVTAEGMKVSLPDERYQKAFDLDKTFLLLLYDGQAITPGVSQYHMMWFRDAAYLVPALERIGHVDKARAILNSYPDRQTEDGFFRSHNGEWDSNGQAMWTLVNHFRMTGDTGFLEAVYPSLLRGARWLEGMCRHELPAGDPRYGLLPPGISAEHFGISDCYYWDDLWAVAGLRATGSAARALGRDGDAQYAERLAADLMRDLERSWRRTAERLGREVLPIAPGRDVDAAAIGMLAASYPLELLDPEAPALANTVREIVERCFYRDTHFHSVMHCGLNPYLSMHVAQYFLRRRDQYALTIFESLWSMRTATYTFPEAINPLTGGGAYGDGHDGWAAADILNFVRNLLVFEEGERLALLPLARRDWFAEGERIEVSGAPTYFGTVDYTVSCGADALEYSLPRGYRAAPAELELGVPFPITGCEADGKAVAVERDARAVRVPATARNVTVRIER